MLYLIWGFLSSLIVAYYAVFGWYLWEACSFFFWRETGEVALGEMGGGGENWEGQKEGKLPLGCMREETKSHTVELNVQQLNCIKTRLFYYY